MVDSESSSAVLAGASESLDGLRSSMSRRLLWTPLWSGGKHFNDRHFTP